MRSTSSVARAIEAGAPHRGAAAALCAVLLMGAALAALVRERAAAPMDVVRGAARLEAALERAPWVGVNGAGPVVWALARAPCACEAFEAQARALQDSGYEVRTILVAAPNAGRDAQARALDHARAALEDRGMDEPGEAEGYNAWGAFVWSEIEAVLAENSVSATAPLLIWRERGAWRVAQGQGAVAAARARPPAA